MKRRAFLQVLPFVSILGCRSHTTMEPAETESFDPPPRWEWEVGEWEDSQRIWSAEVDTTPKEAMAIVAGVQRVNNDVFCGVSGGFIQVYGVTGEIIGHGLLRTKVTLIQGRHRAGVFHIVDIEREKHEVVLPYVQANFYELFRGGHATGESLLGSPVTYGRDREKGTL